ncbi:hypothetical protein Phpb_03802 [Photorhabdus namnaonensis]|uniref:Uncharacterized protein n=1 Tax=Photorhabdus namnaonensis TaxID=1851568 RepID=A0A1B8YDH8_9GAMM|nr:hypothetical protein Phpb_03802 [Photorhabdus namnaonensis]
MLFIQKSGIFSRTINAKGHLFGNKTNIKDDFTNYRTQPCHCSCKAVSALLACCQRFEFFNSFKLY